MKQQVFVIHGGMAFDTYEEYFGYLQNKEVSLEKLQGRDWKMNLQESLGGEYDVFLPKMPNSQNAVYKEWYVWFEKFLPLLNDGVILVGHSLGAVFLAKYLSEHTVTKKIKATLLVAPPFGRDLGEPLPQFSITEPLTTFETQGGKISIYHSKDDPVVDFAELAHYQAQLPEAVANIFEDRGHFNMEDFPEMVEEIRSISNYN
jgi:predicted alpha/beta hydrolase family esterase